MAGGGDGELHLLLKQKLHHTLESNIWFLELVELLNDICH